MGKNKPTDFDSIIRQAVEAGRVSGMSDFKDISKQTEKRLREYQTLRIRIEDNKERLEELRKLGPRGRSRSIVRYQKSGVRLEPEEIFDAIVIDMESTIKADEEEIEMIDRALSLIEKDSYSLAVTGKYLCGMTDEEIGEEIGCDPTTVWRNRKRLLQTIMTYLYGVRAVR